MLPLQVIDNVIHSQSLVSLQQTFHKVSNGLRTVRVFCLVKGQLLDAVIAFLFTHMGLKGGLTQVAELDLPSTQVGLYTVLQHLVHTPNVCILALNGGRLIVNDHVLNCLPIPILEVHETISFLSVSPRSSTLLSII